MRDRMQRTPFQGVVNVLRFNWHLLAPPLVVGAVTPLAAWMLAPQWLLPAVAVSGAALAPVLISLAATYWAYDRTGLYDMAWMDTWMQGVRAAANVHAGFDETTPLLAQRYGGAAWSCLDFYDPARHSEVSIRRARRAWPPLPETQQVTTRHLPLEDSELDRVILFLAAHEVRDAQERMAFFAELSRVLADEGLILMTEHVRDLPNWLAYALGALHFHPRKAWLETFARAGWEVRAVHRNNLFIQTFILAKS